MFLNLFDEMISVNCCWDFFESDEKKDTKHIYNMYFIFQRTSCFFKFQRDIVNI